MAMLRTGWKVTFLIAVLVVSVSGCGENIFEDLADKNSKANNIEAAQIALDARDYTLAITILQKMCGTDLSNPTCEPETRELLASAYSGRAGLDVITLIRLASTSSFTSFASFSTLVPAPTESNKTDLQNAVTLLSGISSRSAEQNLLLAIYAAADVIVTVGVDLTNGFDSTGSPNYFPTVSEIMDAESNFGTVSRVTNDINLIVQGLNGSGLVNKDLTDDINEIHQNLDSNLDGTVTANELEAYLLSL